MATVTATDISIDIPIYDVASTSLRNVLIGRAVGGRFGKVGGTVVINALKNVTFDAREGDRIGLVGRNGSGKTTLLRVLADIYPPTRGSLHVDGRVSPMLDASLGMTADATGLENVRICGVLWGLSPAQIEASLDDVAEFTELGEYLQVPVRAYSAGMLLRLAFAIATLREPDVLLLDEVIAVGDASFYNKAFQRLQRMISKSRIMFVASHVNAKVQELCNKALWLHQGELVAFGPVDEVLKDYTKSQQS
jgi:ABC-2 type transport system ATP-binding protein/lipopolysaccharide transport system ATP-binding protein